MRNYLKPVTALLTGAMLALASCGGGSDDPVEPKPVAVTGVSLNKTAISLVEGDSETLTATVTPSDAANKAVAWSSSNGAVATVDNEGKVTATGAGTATITVITADGGKTATCAVTVSAPVINYVEFRYSGKDYKIGDNETCFFTRRSDEYYTVSCSNAASGQAFTMTAGIKLASGQEYDIYASSVFVAAPIRILFSVGDELSEESFWTDDMSQTGIIGKLTVTELTDTRLSGTFNCRMTKGEITNGKFSVKAKEY
jgi:hypothetical protein